MALIRTLFPAMGRVTLTPTIVLTASTTPVIHALGVGVASISEIILICTGFIIREMHVIIAIAYLVHVTAIIRSTIVAMGATTRTIHVTVPFLTTVASIPEAQG